MRVGFVEKESEYFYNLDIKRRVNIVRREYIFILFVAKERYLLSIKTVE